MKVKPAIIGLALVGMYLISVFAFAILQAVRPSNQTNILDYRLDPSSRYQLIQQGATIFTFEYSSKCENCFDQKNFLETIANDYKNQVILEEILNETFAFSKLTVASMYGNRTFTNPTENEIFNAICDFMYAPPAICAAR